MIIQNPNLTDEELDLLENALQHYLELTHEATKQLYDLSEEQVNKEIELYNKTFDLAKKIGVNLSNNHRIG